MAKEYGIEKLAGIGGNDTERELLTAIQTGPNLTTSKGSNISRIDRQIAAFEFIGQSRAEFQSRWRAEHGSLERVAQSGPYAGQTFDEGLANFQRTEAQRTGLLGAAPVPTANPQGVADQNNDQADITESDIEYTMRVHGMTREQVLQRLGGQ